MIELKYNGKLQIATAATRFTKTWRNGETTWQELLNKLSKTTRTGETIKQFLALKKNEQDNIKDVGGFFGGYLIGGKRGNNSVLARQLITLDIDEGKGDLWDNFCMLFDCAAAVYSTHKHTAEKPRLRLLIPLKEEVTPEEYEAISRYIASCCGINQFDDTTFQPARFMYYPSTPSDGEYIFNYQDGKWLDGKAILKENYRRWQDRSEWSYSSRVPAEIKREVSKQENPLKKDGWVGVFCRTYTVGEAIDAFLSEVYKQESANRYTYLKGSTSNGLVIYENGLFAFSNHSTDPASGHLRNAFDLVRVHLFGTRDDEASETTKATDKPSFKAMAELCKSDENVKATWAAERAAEQEELAEAAAQEFSEEIKQEQSEEKPKSIAKDRAELLTQLEVSDRGIVLPTLKNYRTIIERDPLLKGKIRFDLFANQACVNGSLPWRKIKNYYESFWTNTDDACLRNYLNGNPYNLKASIQNTQDAFDMVMLKHSFHPIQEFVNTAKWDGKKRVETLLIDYLGAEDSELNRAITRKAFVACVARVFNPGVKFDYVLTLVGSEGIGKSTILAKLGGKWFSDSFIGVEGQKGMEQLQRAWLIELGELSVYKKADVETMKAFISKCEDQFRPAYGRKVEIFPRQCVFFATTNEYNFLKGDTGNRRFWIINVGEKQPSRSMYTDLTSEEVLQIWAEAKKYYDEGEELYLPKELEQKARNRQKEHEEVDEREGLIEEFLEKRLPQSWEEKTITERRVWFLQEGDTLREEASLQRTRITAVEILSECFGERIDDKTRYKTRGVNAILKKMEGWRYIGNVRGDIYGKQRTFERIDKEPKPAYTTYMTANEDIF